MIHVQYEEVVLFAGKINYMKHVISQSRLELVFCTTDKMRNLKTRRTATEVEYCMRFSRNIDALWGRMHKRLLHASLNWKWGTPKHLTTFQVNNDNNIQPNSRA